MSVPLCWTLVTSNFKCTVLGIMKIQSHTFRESLVGKVSLFSHKDLEATGFISCLKSDVITSDHYDVYSSAIFTDWSCSSKEYVGKRTNRCELAMGKLCLRKGVLCCQKAEGLDQPFIWKRKNKMLTALERESSVCFLNPSCGQCASNNR